MKKIIACCLLLPVASALTAQKVPSAKELVSKMTLEEKVNLVVGMGMKQPGMDMSSGSGTGIGQTMDKVDRMQVQNALETAPSGRSVAWTNPDTGHAYTVVPTKTFYPESSAQPCREYTTTARIGGKRQQVYGTACRQADGSWRVAQ